ncbi:MAG: metal ABC transporter permease [Deltaproteobacteria bacterium]|nr:metal ABC transporter permease [Deltaproteobacteria bacterium]
MSGLWGLLAVMPAALAMCFVLTGVHGYLGLHVLRRKVIFVDLALAQIAALGGLTAMALGFDPEHGDGGEAHLHLFVLLGWDVPAPPDEVMVYALSLAFALGGAAIFAFTRMRDERVPQEAFIGVTFATAIAVALLMLTRVGGGAEQIRNMLARDALLFATWGDVAKTGLLYGAIAAFHGVYWRRFFAISDDPEKARADGLNLRLWDFLFYASFALVITESVQIAGVLLVFSYLVVPGAVGVLFAERIGWQVVLAWASGLGISALGLLLCAWDNLEPPGSSPGPWIVAGLAGLLLLVGVVRAYRGTAKRGRFLARGAVVLVLVLLGAGFLNLLSKAEVHDHAHGQAHAPGEQGELEDPILEALAGGPAEQLRALEAIEADPKEGHAAAIARLLQTDPPPQVTEPALELLAAMADPATADALVHTSERELDPGLKVTTARALGKLKDRRAIPILLSALEAGLAPFDAMDAGDLLGELTGRTIDAECSECLGKLREWWESEGETVEWDEEAGAFRAPSP